MHCVIYPARKKVYNAGVNVLMTSARVTIQWLQQKVKYTVHNVHHRHQQSVKTR
jgi:hypothetical protein